MNWLKKLFGMGKKEEAQAPQNEAMEASAPQEPVEAPQEEEGGEENNQ